MQDKVRTKEQRRCVLSSWVYPKHSVSVVIDSCQICRVQVQYTMMTCRVLAGCACNNRDYVIKNRCAHFLLPLRER